MVVGNKSINKFFIYELHSCWLGSIKGSIIDTEQKMPWPFNTICRLALTASTMVRLITTLFYQSTHSSIFQILRALIILCQPTKSPNALSLVEPLKPITESVIGFRGDIRIGNEFINPVLHPSDLQSISLTGTMSNSSLETASSIFYWRF